MKTATTPRMWPLCVTVPQAQRGTVAQPSDGRWHNCATRLLLISMLFERLDTSTTRGDSMNKNEGNIVRARVSDALLSDLLKIMKTQDKTISQVLRDSLEYYTEQDRIVRRLNVIHDEQTRQISELLSKVEESPEIFLKKLRDNFKSP